MIFLCAMAALTALPPGPRPKAKRPDYIAVLVARSFLRALEERDSKQSVTLCADSVNFDGQVVSGATKVETHMKDLVKRFPAGYRFRTVFFLSYRDAIKRFGPPPRRLMPSRLKGSVVAFGRLEHKGLVVFVTKVKGRWRVIALSD